MCGDPRQLALSPFAREARGLGEPWIQSHPDKGRATLWRDLFGRFPWSNQDRYKAPASPSGWFDRGWAPSQPLNVHFVWTGPGGRLTS